MLYVTLYKYTLFRVWTRESNIFLTSNTHFAFLCFVCYNIYSYICLLKLVINNAHYIIVYFILNVFTVFYYMASKVVYYCTILIAPI